MFRTPYADWDNGHGGGARADRAVGVWYLKMLDENCTMSHGQSVLKNAKLMAEIISPWDFFTQVKTSLNQKKNHNDKFNRCTHFLVDKAAGLVPWVGNRIICALECSWVWLALLPSPAHRDRSVSKVTEWSSERWALPVTTCLTTELQWEVPGHSSGAIPLPDLVSGWSSPEG